MSLLHVELTWTPVFVWFPRRTISGKWCWGRCYQRVVWCYDLMAIEPEYQYGDLFDVLQNPNT
jgi:hypothetical protein